ITALVTGIRLLEPMIVHSGLPPIASKVCNALSKACSPRAANAQPMESKMSALACVATSAGIVVGSNARICFAICFTNGVLEPFDFSLSAIDPQRPPSLHPPPRGAGEERGGGCH